MPRQKSEVSPDPSYHRKGCTKFIRDVAAGSAKAANNLKGFLDSLQSLFGDYPPTTWRLRNTTYTDIVFRINNKLTGKQHDLLIVTPHGIIILSKFLREDEKVYFPAKNTFYGTGDAADFRWDTFGPRKQQIYLAVFRNLLSSSPLAERIGVDAVRLARLSSRTVHE
jgi:hypothetical protein